MRTRRERERDDARGERRAETARGKWGRPGEAREVPPAVSLAEVGRGRAGGTRCTG